MLVFRLLPQDFDKVAQLVNSAYRGESSRRGWTTEADFLGGQRTSAEDLRDEIAQHPERLLLGFRLQGEGPLVACVQLEFAAEKDGAVSCHLGMLTVEAERQNQRFGRHVLEVAEGLARERGAGLMKLNVIFLRQSLTAWYERRGYRATGRIFPFPYHNPRAGEPLRKDLHFLEFAKKL